MNKTVNAHSQKAKSEKESEMKWNAKERPQMEWGWRVKKK